MIGERAIVEAGASIVESVVWPGARATGAHTRAVITPRQVVEA